MIAPTRNLFATALSKIEIGTSFHTPADSSWQHICLLPKEHMPCNQPETFLPELIVDDLTDWSEDLSKAKPSIVKKRSYTVSIPTKESSLTEELKKDLQNIKNVRKAASPVKTTPIMPKIGARNSLFKSKSTVLKFSKPVSGRYVM